MTIIAPPRTSNRYDRLVQADRVHGTVYTEPAIFADEMEQIFRRGWVYVGHESEIAEAGAYRVKPIGLQKVVMTRDAEGHVHVMYDRCPHRGNKICKSESGVARSLTCPYHGWTFSMDGRLIGLPGAAAFGPDFDKSSSGMAKLPRVDSYGGFVFASMSPTGISLDEHLGNGKRMIDQLLEMSPSGAVELTGGWMKHRFYGNWKNLVENQVDGYHAVYVHGSLLSANRDWAGERDRREDSEAVARDLGMGHSDIDHIQSYRDKGTTLRWTGNVPEERVPSYVSAMRAAYGEDAQRRLVDGPPHAMIFPNLFLAEMNIMVVQPVSADETIHHTTPVLLKGGAELNERSMRRCEGALGPAGLLIADDAEISQLNQIGLQTAEPEWVQLKRGLHDEAHLADGTRIGRLNDETSQRAFWRHYREVMNAS